MAAVALDASCTAAKDRAARQWPRHCDGCARLLRAPDVTGRKKEPDELVQGAPQAAPFTSILRALLWVGLGIVKRSTPFSIVAVIVAGSMPAGSSTERENVP